MKRYFLILLFTCQAAAATITTPYPETIRLKQINSSEKERTRLGQGHNKYDRQPTGFYIEAGKKLAVNVTVITAPADGAKPVLYVGTLGFNVDGRTVTNKTLNEGTNTFTVSNDGLIYLRYVSDAAQQPVGEVEITFTAASEHRRAPRFVHGVTTDGEFAEMMEQYQTPDVTYHSDYVIVCATRTAATTHSLGQNKNNWLNQLNTLVSLEDQISGMNDGDPKPVHHRLKAAEIRYLLVQNTSNNPHASSSGYTGYPSGSVARYLTMFGSGNNSWMLGHEIGHQHQQPAYMINSSSESTVNIYSYVVERDQVERIQGGGPYNRTSAARWKQAQDTYLSLPLSERVYDMPNDELEKIIGFNRDELRFMMWEQFFLIFGDEFYKRLHRITREEKITGGGADERRAYLIWKASQITGYDLTDFFDLWGVRIKDDNALNELLRARIFTALKRGTIEPLPVPASAMLMVTGQQKPSWTPLPLKGISSSRPAEEFYDRTGWTITASIAGVQDATVGGDKPEYIIDGTSNTAFVFIKPGKTLGGVTGPADYIPSFTIDMQKKYEFNSFIYRHRTGNTEEGLRARGISVFGKNTETEEWMPIVENYVIDHVQNKDEIRVNLDDMVEYRYIKAVITDWNRTSSNTIQVSNFNIGISANEDLLTPDPKQCRVTVNAGAGVIFAGETQFEVTENTDFTLTFSVGTNYDNPTVTADNKPVETAVSGGVYTVALHIANHTTIKITATLKKLNVRINKGEGILLVAPMNGKAEYGSEFSSTFNLMAGYGNPAITDVSGASGAVIAGNEIRIPSVTSDVELTISASKLTGINELLREDIKIYPNPVIAGQRLTVDISGMRRDGLLKICSADGKVFEQRKIAGREGIMMNYAPGAYLMHIIVEDVENVYKIVVQ